MREVTNHLALWEGWFLPNYPEEISKILHIFLSTLFALRKFYGKLSTYLLMCSL